MRDVVYWSLNPATDCVISDFTVLGLDAVWGALGVLESVQEVRRQYCLQNHLSQFPVISDYPQLCVRVYDHHVIFPLATERFEAIALRGPKDAGIYLTAGGWNHSVAAFGGSVMLRDACSINDELDRSTSGGTA